MYITALCIQWSKGGVTGEEMARLGRAMALPSIEHVKGKFKQGSDGLFRNQRLEHERRKQREYRENRKKSGVLGAKSRWHSHSTAIAQPMASGMANDSSPSPSPSPIAERAQKEKDFPEANGRMTLQEVKDTASMIGLAEWKAVDWFNEMEGCGWRDHNQRPIHNGQAVLARVKTKWEGDGRPAGPPKQKSYGNTNSKNNNDRNAGTYNEGRAHLYKDAVVRGKPKVSELPNVQ